MDVSKLQFERTPVANPNGAFVRILNSIDNNLFFEMLTWVLEHSDPILADGFAIESIAWRSQTVLRFFYEDDLIAFKLKFNNDVKQILLLAKPGQYVKS